MDIKTAHRRSKLEKFSMRLNQYYLALDLDRETAKNGRLRNDPAVIKEILKRCGWTKSTLKYHRGQGNKWKQLCGPYDGLLCFMFLEAGIYPSNKDRAF
jgi:hypothetical protein